MYLRANPHFYDYAHHIQFDKPNICKFVDGGGQCLNLALLGTYTKSEDPNNRHIEFDIYLKDMFWDPPVELSAHKKFRVNYRIEERLFVLRDEVVWKQTLDEWPIQVYKQRYVFEADPFDGLDDSHRENNLYFILEGNKETPDNVKEYYCSNDCQHKMFKNLTDEERDVLRKTDWKNSEADSNDKSDD